jgi:AraC family transcriptional regulator of adaptative response / DNA-3-methyladenine glycosylase II
MALRRAGVADQPVGPTGAVTVRLGYRPPYDWDGIMAFLRARAIPGVEVVSNDRYARSIAIGDACGVLAVEPTERNCLKATVRFPRLKALPAIIARVRRVFDLAADPVAIGPDLSRDAALAPVLSMCEAVPTRHSPPFDPAAYGCDLATRFENAQRTVFSVARNRGTRCLA